MNTVLSTASWAVLAALAGAAAAFLAVRAYYAVLLRNANAKAERAVRARARANELLLQARRQAELMQKELVLARRQRPVAKPLVTPLPVPDTVVDDEPELPAGGFAQTMPFVG